MRVPVMMGANIVAGRRVFYAKEAYYLPYTVVFLRILSSFFGYLGVLSPVRGGSDQAIQQIATR